MMNHRLFKQIIKNCLHKVFLPCIYAIYRRAPIEKGKILFADSNSDSLPESMTVIYNRLQRRDLSVKCHLLDFRKSGARKIAAYLLSFMKDYATAEYVFICNYFLPVTSCKKRRETTVIQLWHSCGLLKKFAYDTDEDISPAYHGNVTNNISLITVSSLACVPVWKKALRLDTLRQDIVQPIGVSRTDILFDQNWQASCRERFYKACPSYAGKKIILYAPTFRGPASQPYLVGLDAIDNLESELGQEWVVIKKIHPLLGKPDPIPLTSTELFSCADILITDYSSLLFEYILFEKPFIIFAPDYEDYQRARGWYEDPASFPGEFVTEAQNLVAAVKRSYGRKADEKYLSFIEHHSGACDGHATERILAAIGIRAD